MHVQMKKQAIGVTLLLTCLVFSGCKPGQAVQKAASSSLPAVSASSELSESSETSSLAAISGSEPPRTEPTRKPSVLNPVSSEVKPSKPVSLAAGSSSPVSSQPDEATAENRSIIIQGNRYTGVLEPDEKMYQSRDRQFYFMFDKKGQLSLFSLSHACSSIAALSKEEAIAIGEQFIEEQCRLKQIACELKQYTLDDADYIGTKVIKYSKHLYGYKTRQNITLHIEPDGMVSEFLYNPNEFAGVKLPAAFDETPYLAVLDRETKKRYIGSYTIKDRVLFADSGELCMEYNLGYVKFCVSRNKVLDTSWALS